MANLSDSAGSPAAPPPLHSSFPQNPEDFDADPRISFSRVSNKFILETEQEGAEYEFDDKLKRWVPALDEALLEQQQQIYAVKGVDENEPAQAPRNRKRKQEEEEHVNGQDDLATKQPPAAARKKPKQEKEPRERKNTAVYVTNLPLSPPPTVDEINRIFSRCGVIAEEIDARKPRIKLYTNDDGTFKGDALIVYFRAESVDLAIQMLDDSELRLGETKEGKMRVVAADFSYKKVKDEGDGGGGGGGGGGDADTRGKGRSGGGDRKKIIKKTQKLNNKLADWDDDDPSSFALSSSSSRWDKVVILKHMFTLAELAADPAATLDIKEDIRDECAKMGEVTNVALFDLEPEGVASVRFAARESAEMCVRVMEGRHFDGRVVRAYVADGMERFRKRDGRGDVREEEQGEGDEDDGEKMGGRGGGE